MFIVDVKQQHQQWVLDKCFYFNLFCIEIPVSSIDPDQMPHFVAFELGLHSLHNAIPKNVYLGPVVHSIVSLTSKRSTCSVIYDFITKYTDIFC